MVSNNTISVVTDEPNTEGTAQHNDWWLLFGHPSVDGMENWAVV